MRAWITEYFSSLFFLIFITLTLTSIQLYAGESIATVKQYNHIVEDDIGKFRLHLQSIATLTNISVNGFRASELSGLSWDKDEGLLYALSDNGYLLHLKPVFKNSQLLDILLVRGHSLYDSNNRPLKWKWSDSEGIIAVNSDNNVRGDTEFIVCFERHPRIVRFNFFGHPLETLNLPNDLDKSTSYQSENKMLESITVHPKYGLLTGIEKPLKNQMSETLNLFSLNGTYWQYPVRDQSRGSLVGITVTKDNNLLLLERAYYPIWQKFLITIHLVSPGDDVHPIISRFTVPETILNENFEGITHYLDDYFFIISDDNNHPFKRTSLLFFNIEH